MNFITLVTTRYKIEAGDVVPFRKKDGSPVPFKEKEKETKVKDLLKNPSKESFDLLKHLIREEKNIDWIDPKTLHALVKRFNDSPEILKTLEKLVKEGHDSPYYGKDTHDILWRGKHEKSASPFPLPAKVGDLKGILGKDVPVGHGEPFMWMDTKYKISQNLLQKNFKNALQINTRSDLIAHDDYIALLNPAKHIVNIHLASLNEDFNKHTEPGAPSVRRRIQAAAKLAEKGIRVFLVHDKFEGAKMSDTLRMVNEVTRSGVSHYANIQSIKSFMKENKVKLTEQQVTALNTIADEVSKTRKAENQ